MQALISVGGTAINVVPQGLNIAPSLIAVTPGRVAINPQGGNIAPVALSVSAPAAPADTAKPASGRRRRTLRQSFLEDVGNTVHEVTAGAEAAAAAAASDFFQAMSPPAAPSPAVASAPGPAHPTTPEVQIALTLQSSQNKATRRLNSAFGPGLLEFHLQSCIIKMSAISGQICVFATRPCKKFHRPGLDAIHDHNAQWCPLSAGCPCCR